jgi:hypothetical protein
VTPRWRRRFGPVRSRELTPELRHLLERLRTSLKNSCRERLSGSCGSPRTCVCVSYNSNPPFRRHRDHRLEGDHSWCPRAVQRRRKRFLIYGSGIRNRRKSLKTPRRRRFQNYGYRQSCCLVSWQSLVQEICRDRRRYGVCGCCCGGWEVKYWPRLAVSCCMPARTLRSRAATTSGTFFPSIGSSCE